MSVVIGSVPYLNARPLVDWFMETEEGRATGVTVVEAVPSKLDGMLKRGEVVCALLSSVTRFRNPGWIYAPGAAICSDGPVASVRLFSKVPVPNIKSVALDSSSLTSVTLTRIILGEKYGIDPVYLPNKPDLDAMLTEADAALLIGDNGFREYDPNLITLDLGQEWTDWTKLPFVYALWLGPPTPEFESIAPLLLRAKEWGTANVRHIAEHSADRHGRDVQGAIHYMTESIRYNLGSREEQGMALFGEKLVKAGLV